MRVNTDNSSGQMTVEGVGKHKHYLKHLQMKQK